MSSLLNIHPRESLQMGKMLVSKPTGHREREREREMEREGGREGERERERERERGGSVNNQSINNIFNSLFFVLFTFMHLADAFIQSDLQCIQAINFLSVCVFPGNRTHNLCAANAMLYH